MFSTLNNNVDAHNFRLLFYLNYCKQFKVYFGILVPTHVYLFLSHESYMLDEGIAMKDVPFELQ